jgi:hypothetical protein
MMVEWVVVMSLAEGWGILIEVRGYRIFFAAKSNLLTTPVKLPILCV